MFRPIIDINDDEPNLVESTSSMFTHCFILPKENTQKFIHSPETVMGRRTDEATYDENLSGFLTPKVRISRNLDYIPSITTETSSIIYLESSGIDIAFPDF